MTRKEAFDFLELTEGATDNDIKTRLSDKLAYFERLSENAPNDFLRKLHVQNIEKVRSIQKMLLQSTASAPVQAAAQNYHTPPQQNHYTPSNAGANYYDAGADAKTVKDVFADARSGAANNAVALLVRHTENQSAKTFPLYLGKNIIGRNEQPGLPIIVIENDPYVSRVHCVIYIEPANPYDYYIADDASSNGGKPSKNGTYINGNDYRITQKTRLRENDTIQIGVTKFILKSNNTSINKIVHQVEETDYMKTVVIDIF